MLPGKHGLSFNNTVNIPTADWGDAPSPKPAKRKGAEDDNAKPAYGGKPRASSSECTAPPDSPRLLCLTAAGERLTPLWPHCRSAAELLEYGPPLFLLAAVLIVLALGKLGIIKIRF